MFVIGATGTLGVIAIVTRAWDVAAFSAIAALVALVFWKDLDQEDGRP